LLRPRSSNTVGKTGWAVHQEGGTSKERGPIGFAHAQVEAYLDT